MDGDMDDPGASADLDVEAPAEADEVQKSGL